MPIWNGEIMGSRTGMLDDPATMLRLVTPSVNGSASSTNTLADGPCRMIAAASSGTISYYDHTSVLISSFPVFAGLNRIGARQILSTGSTLTSVTPPAVWACY